MQISNRQWLVAGIGFLLAVLIASLFPRTTATPPSPVVYEQQAVESASTSAMTSASTSIAKSSQSRVVPLLTIAKGDIIVSWDFGGAYANNPELIAKAEAEITRLLSLVGKGTYPDMNLYVSIANQYGLLGNGEQEYAYLGRAIGVGGAATGLPWHNLGVLMERLGALQTARVAYEESTVVQPQMKTYHYAYFEFLTKRMKDDTVTIEKEFTAALANLGQDSDILQLYSEWKKS